MKRLIDLDAAEAKQHLSKASSYFNGDFPEYISFETILNEVAKVLDGKEFWAFKKENPADHPGVNYSFVANKDGRFAWRPFELMNPAIYVSLVNLICADENWKLIVSRFGEFESGVVECCSSPVLSVDEQSDKATQVASWWQRVEQRSIANSLQFSHILHTDVSDCYGSIYTHSIAWALHGVEDAKQDKGKGKLLGSQIDRHIQASRYGQTNGISQGSLLMDFIAEIVLGHVDLRISEALNGETDFKILRYRDDYRIFANSDHRCDVVLKVISDELRAVGMKLNVSKTQISTNVVSGSIKEDKLAGIDLQDLGTTNAKTIQKQLIRLHAFGRRFPNSGALRRLVGELHARIASQKIEPDDLDVQVAIATDIALVSPLTFPAVAGILSHLIALKGGGEKERLWESVKNKMGKVPHNGYLEVWLQRVIKPKTIGIEFNSTEAICQIVNGKNAMLWNNDWVSSVDLKKAMSEGKIVVNPPEDAAELVSPEEIELFNKAAASY